MKKENIIFSNMREWILAVLYILKTFHPSDFFEKVGESVGNGPEGGT